MGEEKPSGEFSVSRRDFLRGLGVTVGGATIGGARGYDAYGQGVIPRDYTFYPVLFTNPALNPLLPWDVGSLTPGVFLGSFNSPGNDPNLSTIFYHGTSKSNHAPTVYQMLLRFNPSSSPTILGITRILWRDDRLAYIRGVPQDQLPLQVSRIGTGSGNALGNYATSILAEDTGELNPDGSLSLKSLPGVYLFVSETKVWEKVVRCGDPSPDGAQYGGIMGDVVLNDDNSVTMVAATTKNPFEEQQTASHGASGVVGSQVLVHVDRRRPGEVLLQTGDMLPRTNAMIESFGLIDVVKGRNFIAQVNARRIDILNSRPGSAVVRGRVNFTGKNRMDGVELLSASSNLLPESMLNDGSLLVGESILGPRIGRAGLAAVIIHDPRFSDSIGELEKHHLTAIQPGGQRSVIVRAGDAFGPRVVGALSAPVVSSEAGLTYITEILDDGSSQLVVSDNMENSQVILRSGDFVSGSMVTDINQGYHPAQVDVNGRLAFTVELLRDTGLDPNNPDNILTALVIGVPA